jgi:hypothetical protein
MLSRMLNKIEEYWKEGKYFDLWSVNHVLTGVMLGGVLFGFGVPFAITLWISLALFIAWEIFEITSDVKEHILNLLMDVVFDLVGLFFSAWVYLTLKKSFSPLVWILLALTLTIFTLRGYIAYRRRVK